MTKLTTTAMKLRFIGTDGSLGFKHGKVYVLETCIHNNYIWVRLGRRWSCPYSSVNAFLQNWEVV